MTTQARVIPLAIAALVAILIVAAQPAAAADTPIDTTFTYQGYLEYNGGPINNEECTIDFTLWDAETGGTQAGGTHQATVYPENGYFTTAVDLGSGGLGLATFAGSMRWLQLDVDCESDDGSGTILPRQPITATPYAMSLMPNTGIIGTVPNQTVLTVGNTTTGQYGSAIKAQTSASQGTALIARSTADGLDESWGVYATTVSRSGTAVYGESLAGGSDISGTGYGGYFVANAANDSGVYGEAAWTAGQGIGGEFKTNARHGYGVWAEATNMGDPENTATGVYGKSVAAAGYGGHFVNNNNVGVRAVGSIGISASGDPDLYLGGHGTIVAADEASSKMSLRSNDDVSIYLDDDNTDASSTFTVFDGTSHVLPVFEVNQDGDVEIGGDVEISGDVALLGPLTEVTVNFLRVVGNFEVTGDKNAVVSTPNYGVRKVHSLESTGSWFEDFGVSELKDGAATVDIEPVFAETVSTGETYHVFLTPLGDCALYVAEKTPASFTVRARGGEACNAEFDYRIVARRRGFEQARLERVER